jgi:hypothetical protein
VNVDGKVVPFNSACAGTKASPGVQTPWPLQSSISTQACTAHRPALQLNYIYPLNTPASITVFSTPPISSLIMSFTVTTSLPKELADIDLSNYDAEQSKLMDERCILVDGEDRAYGAADKKTCA